MRKMQRRILKIEMKGFAVALTCCLAELRIDENVRLYKTI